MLSSRYLIALDFFYYSLENDMNIYFSSMFQRVTEAVQKFDQSKQRSEEC